MVDMRQITRSRAWSATGVKKITDHILDKRSAPHPNNVGWYPCSLVTTLAVTIKIEPHIHPSSFCIVGLFVVVDSFLYYALVWMSVERIRLILSKTLVVS